MVTSPRAPPRILDCFDFDDQLRYVDCLDDAAFLATPLEPLVEIGISTRSNSDRRNCRQIAFIVSWLTIRAPGRETDDDHGIVAS
ncbi:hypothetical protein GFY24_40330 [Nocardia sp. SYP-A9097]|nr:hypothetical protein [Nocardia sp. SYP-A9097]